MCPSETSSRIVVCWAHRGPIGLWFMGLVPRTPHPPRTLPPQANAMQFIMDIQYNEVNGLHNRSIGPEFLRNERNFHDVTES